MTDGPVPKDMSETGSDPDDATDDFERARDFFEQQYQMLVVGLPLPSLPQGKYNRWCEKRLLVLSEDQDDSVYKSLDLETLRE